MTNQKRAQEQLSSSIIQFHLVNTFNHLRLDPVEVLGELDKPLVVVLVLLGPPDELGQAGHHGGHGPPGVLVRVLGVQAVVLQSAPPLSQSLVSSILKN